MDDPEKDAFLQDPAGQNREIQAEPFLQLIFPLIAQASGTDDETSLHVFSGNQFLDEQPGHDGFPHTGIIRLQKPQGNTWQYFLIDC